MTIKTPSTEQPAWLGIIGFVGGALFVGAAWLVQQAILRKFEDRAAGPKEI